MSRYLTNTAALTTRLLITGLSFALLASCDSPSNTSLGDQLDSVLEDDRIDDSLNEPNDGNIDSATGDNSAINDGTNLQVDSLFTPDRVLSELPDPPHSPAPTEASEPVRAENRTTTISEFFALREPEFLAADTSFDLTDEDFDAGPLPPVYQIPDNVDPETNAPPFFHEITNAEVFAGEELSLRFEPRDPDGGLPGMFPGSRPLGSVFEDNFDGTKSLVWRPLQPAVGIHEFTVTAIDTEDSAYRTTQTVRIRVNLPADTSAIRNTAPSVNLIAPRTVRVNDPVVLYIKAGDANGTIPSLIIDNPPPGSTQTAHPFDEAITILHFVPDTTGVVSLELQAIDAEDPSLTGQQTVTLEVLADEDFDRPGSRLRDLASARDFLFGYAALQSFYQQPDGAIYTHIAGEEFNIVSTENSLKFDFANPLPGKYRWAATDNLVQLAKAQRQTIHGHTLVWYAQLPPWVKNSALEDREIIMREFIDRVLQRYADDIPLWDVVNESLEEDGTLRRSVWWEGMGADYIDIAFRQARESAPDATLIYNDYDIAFAGAKSDGMLNLMQHLKDAGTPVDGVGFQLHLFADFDRVNEVIDTFQKVADMDFDIYITELDISIDEGQTEEQQAALYEQLLSACLDQPRCKAFQAWGFTDMYSWRSQFSPMMFDKSYQIKPAYLSLQRRLSEN